MSDSGSVGRVKDGRVWRIGTDADVAWIANGTAGGLTIASAIPPIFQAYATIVIPGADDDRVELDSLLLQLLSRYSGEQPWWLGYLDTGGDDVVFPDEPMVALYSAGWQYVLVQAGPQEAASWRNSSSCRRGVLPDLLFPADRSWLLSTLWDDDWRCLGGSHDLMRSVVQETRLQARTVSPGQDATPPGHVSR